MFCVRALLPPLPLLSRPFPGVALPPGVSLSPDPRAPPINGPLPSPSRSPKTLDTELDLWCRCRRFLYLLATTNIAVTYATPPITAETLAVTAVALTGPEFEFWLPNTEPAPAVEEACGLPSPGLPGVPEPRPCPARMGKLGLIRFMRAATLSCGFL